MSIAAIVLAAGASRRLGRPKQQVVIAGETLLDRTVRVVREASLSSIIVVVREPPARAWLARDVRVVFNDAADEGIASSIRCGVASASECNAVGAVILACDQPALSAAHLRKLVLDRSRLTASAYGDCVGIPAYFPESFFASLLRLRGDQGARQILKAAHAIEAEELQLDIDTEQDLDAARALFELSSGDERAGQDES